MGSSDCFRWAVVILCCSSLTHGHLEREHSPMILPSDNTLILHKDGLLHLTCRGHGPLQWKLVDSNRSLSSEEVKVESCDSRHHSHSHCSKLTITSLIANDTGRYNCEYSKNGSAHFTSIYVSRATICAPSLNTSCLGKLQARDQPHTPCRTTYPDIEVTLIGFPPLPEKVVNEKYGIRRLDSRFPTIPTERSAWSPVKPRIYSYICLDFAAHVLQNVKITPERVKVLVGDTLILNCTGTTTHNGRIKFTWDFPKSKENRHESQNTVDLSTKVYVMSRSLFLPNITMEDKGVYRCRAELNPTIDMNVTAKVIVIEHPYLNISYKHERHSTIRVKEGRKRLVFDPKVQALPPPDMVAWMGSPINRSSTCYKMSGFTLIIVNVQQQNAGVFTVSLGNQARGLHRNLSFTLIVEVKPIISEAELATVDVQPYMIGRRHQSPVHIDDRGNYSYNWIKSINVKPELVKGKIKIVSTLVIGNASMSGKYSCVARNEEGHSSVTIPFYVDDNPEEIAIEPRAVVEGDDVNLTCRATRYLYTDLQWLDSRNETITTNVSSIQIGNYSISLSLRLHNVSQISTAGYRCQAHKLYKGVQLRDAALTVDVRKRPWLSQNLTNQDVNSSSTLMLRCLAMGVPRPYILWYKNDLLVEKGPGITLGDDGTLTIERVKKDDEGRYECVAINDEGSAKTSAVVTVFGDEGKPNVEVIILVCTGAAATFLWLMLILFIRKLRKQPQYKMGPSIIIDPDECPLEEQNDLLQYDSSKWEFPRDRLRLGENPMCGKMFRIFFLLPFYLNERKTLGHGAFGKVVEASAFGIDKLSTCKTVAEALRQMSGKL
ncbi:hypothetical protein F7725_010342 [Dissostichus mawsoni]|uniref:Ig-like domain-containing protein n=1 Tax=Dissostichus mawsoni TaxID=36200 RepID=A0A7J5XNC6_DISMA|nr:hypothetical protein F7725_010342 [Dissostichus mawsoni]